MRKLLAFTGAGISKESGIPTFEELGDLRNKLSRSFFRSNPVELYSILNLIRSKSLEAEPNRAHEALSEYGVPIITMNIDNLHQRAGSKRVIEIHGNLERVYCPKCKTKYEFLKAMENVESPCCGMILQPEVVLYEDGLGSLNDAYRLVDECDGLLIVGTSFYTSTASYIYNAAKARGMEIKIINDNAGVKVPQYLKEFFKNSL